MDLKELIGKPCSELTDEELEFSIQNLSKLKLSKEVFSQGIRPRANKTIKSNKEKQGDDLLSKLTPEQMVKLKAFLGGI